MWHTRKEEKIIQDFGCSGLSLVKFVGARGGAVVEALRYKSEFRGIDSRWCRWNFSLT
jgi:hypothetical protein